MSWIPGNLRLITWNVWEGQDAGDIALPLRQMIAVHDPDVICLQEATGCGRGLRERFGNEWHVIFFRGWAESEQLVTMVHRRKKVTASTYLRMAVAWIGPKHGLIHAGRTFHVVDLGRHNRIVNVHRVTGGPEGPNAKAFAEEDAALRKLAGSRRSKRRNLVMVGDWNRGFDSPYTVKLAADLGAVVVNAADAAIDYALVRLGERMRRLGHHAWKLNRHGSDHPAVRLQLSWRRAKVDR